MIFLLYQPSHAPTVTSLFLESIIFLGFKDLITEQAVVFLCISLEWLYVGLVDVVDDNGGNSYYLQEESRTLY